MNLAAGLFFVGVSEAFAVEEFKLFQDCGFSRVSGAFGVRMGILAYPIDSIEGLN